jgi:ABC-type dipeptide/oligopeptide/nickel transport system permease component
VPVSEAILEQLPSTVALALSALAIALAWLLQWGWPPR